MEEVSNNIRLLNEMLAQFDPEATPLSDLETMKVDFQFNTKEKLPLNQGRGRVKMPWYIICWLHIRLCYSGSIWRLLETPTRSVPSRFWHGRWWESVNGYLESERRSFQSHAIIWEACLAQVSVLNPDVSVKVCHQRTSTVAGGYLVIGSRDPFGISRTGCQRYLGRFAIFPSWWPSNLWPFTWAHLVIDIPVFTSRQVRLMLRESWCCSLIDRLAKVDRNGDGAEAQKTPEQSARKLHFLWSSHRMN